MVTPMRSDRSKIGSHDVGVSADVELNLTGMKCPIPVLRARRQIKQMAPRSVLKVTADDPAAPLDFQHFCDTSGLALLRNDAEGGVFTLHIEVRADSLQGN